MRFVGALLALCGLLCSGLASAVSFDSSLYGVYQVSGPGTTTLYIVPKRSVAVVAQSGGFSVPVAFMPKVSGYQVVVNADGSVGVPTSTTYNSATVSAIGGVPSSYRLYAGDFDGDGQRDLLLQGSGNNSSFILATDAISQNVAVYYNFRNALDSTQKQLSIADVDGNGCADIKAIGAQNYQSEYLSSNFAALFTLVNITPDLSNQPGAPDTDSSSCYADAATLASQQPQDLDLTSKVVNDTADEKIARLAQSLGYSPTRILEYVSNNIAYELYAGAVKGAANTLIAGSGNDIDQAALAIALLREAKIPARFVKGSIYVEDKPQHRDWLQVKTIAAAADTLQKNGIAIDVNASNAAIYYTVNGHSSIKAGHVWVEACVPYANYRGTGADKAGHRWVPIDPSFKAMQRTDGVAHHATFDYTTYLSHRTDDLPFEAYDKAVLANVQASDPNKTLADVGTHWQIQPIHYEFLPDTLPYQVANFVAWDGANGPSDIAKIPDNWRAKFNLAVKGSGVAISLQSPPTPDTSFDVIDAMKGRVTLTFDIQGGDQSALAAFRSGTAPFPCGTSVATIAPVAPVPVVPVVRVGGVTVYQGATAFSSCDANSQPVNLELYLSVTVNGNIQNSIAYNTIAVQDYYALQAYGFQASETYLSEHYSNLLAAVAANPGNPWDDPDDIIGEYLHLVLSKYMRYVSDGVKHIGQLDGYSGTSGMHLGLTRTHADVVYIFDLPFAIGSNSFIVDVAGVKSTSGDIGAGTTISLDTSFRLQMYNGSALESYVWQENALKDAVSTVTGLQIAREKNIDLLTMYSGFINPIHSIDSFGASLSELVQCAAGPTGTYINGVYWPSGPGSYYQFSDGASASAVVAGFRSIGVSDDNQLSDLLNTKAGQKITFPGGDFPVLIPTLTPADIDAGIATESTYCYPSGVISQLSSALSKAGTTTLITIPKSPIKFPLPKKSTDGKTWLPSWSGYLYVDESSDGGVLNKAFVISSFNGGYTVSTPDASIFQTSLTSPYADEMTTGFDASQVPGLILNTGTDGLSNNFNSIISTVSSAVGNGLSNFTTIGGDPVNMVTGNLYHNETDFSLPARGLPITFQRTYNSRDDKDCSKNPCPLGIDWTHSFNQFLTFSAPAVGVSAYRTITWVDGSGAKKFIQLKSAPTSGQAKTWQGSDIGIPAGFYFTVSANFTAGMASGTVVITEKSGIAYTFHCLQALDSCTARLESIADRNGNTLTLTYDGNNNLSKVTDPGQRAITFTYGSAANLHRITKITDWAGRAFQYQYDADGNLVEAINALNIEANHYSYYSSADGPNLNHMLRQYAYPNGVQMNFEYYASGKVYRHYDALNQTSVFTYNDFRREATMVDPRGNTQKYIFNKDGLPTQITEQDGGIWQYDYTDSNNPLLKTKVTDPMGYVTQYAYDSSGNNTLTTLPSKIAVGGTNDTVANTYFSAFGEPRLIKNANGNYALHRYDAMGNLIDEIAFQQGVGAAINPDTYTPQPSDILAWTHSDYDANGNVTKVQQYRDFTAKTGPYTTFDYTDTANNVSGIAPVIAAYYGDVDGDGVIGSGEGLGAYTTHYDNLMRATSGFNRARYPVSASYDAQGRTLTATDNNGQIREFTYDVSGLPTGQSLTSTIGGAPALLDQSTARYDAAGRKIAAADATGAVTAYAYDAGGNLTAITTADGYTVRSTYDASNRLTTSYDAAGHTIKRTYDFAGRVKSTTDPNGNVAQSIYYGPEKNGRLKQQIEPADANDTSAPSGRATTFDYDALGNVTDITDNAGRITHTDYDPLSRPLRIVSPIVHDSNLGIDIRPVTKYTYNNLGYRTQTAAGYTTIAADYSRSADASADVLSVQATYVYDDFGRLLTQTDAAQNAWHFTYDNHGNVATSTDAKGQITTYDYFYGGLLKSKITKTASGAPGESVAYTRDALGQVLSAAANDSYYTYRYDAAHRLQSVSDGRGNKTLTYNYSIGGLLNGIGDSDNNNTTYSYDPVGRLTGICAQNNKAINYFYDNGGRPIEKSFPNGVVTTYSYFNSDRVQTIATRDPQNQLFDQSDYSYDAVGNVLSARHQLPTLPNTPLANTQNLRFAYDALNRLTVVTDGQTNGIVEQTSYDAYGNRYNWSAQNGANAQYYIVNNLQQVTEIHSGSNTGALLYTYHYDANGNMDRQVTSASGATLTLSYDTWDRTVGVADASATELYRYDDSGRRIQKTINGGTTNYLYNGANIFAEYGSDWSEPTAQYAHGAAVDDPLVRFSNGAARYYHADALGSITAVTDDNAILSGGFHYSAWGNPLAVGGTGLPTFAYAGREPTSAGALVYMRARLYMPQLGRFAQPDPLGFVDSVNRYAYVRNSPQNYVDPTGKLALMNIASTMNTGYTVPPIEFNTNSSLQSFASNISNYPVQQIGEYKQPGAVQLSLPSSGSNFLSALAMMAPLLPAAAVVEEGFAAEGARPFAMGLSEGLDEFAAARGASTWKDLADPTMWKSGVLDALSDAKTQVHFNLDGVDVWGGAQRAAAGRGGATDWELLQIKQNPQFWDSLQFWKGGEPAANPFK